MFKKRSSILFVVENAIYSIMNTVDIKLSIVLAFNCLFFDSVYLFRSIGQKIDSAIIWTSSRGMTFFTTFGSFHKYFRHIFMKSNPSLWSMNLFIPTMPTYLDSILLSFDFRDIWYRLISSADSHLDSSIHHLLLTFMREWFQYCCPSSTGSILS
jgi:hypothetical protein